MEPSPNRLIRDLVTINALLIIRIFTQMIYETRYVHGQLSLYKTISFIGLLVIAWA